MNDNFTKEEINYLLRKFNQAKHGKTHLVTPEYMRDLERRRLERQKQKQKLNLFMIVKIEYQELQYPFMVLDELIVEFCDISENQTNKTLKL